FLIAILLIACRGEPYHSFGDAWRTLPAEMQGEVQGLPAHWASVGTEGAVSTANALASEAAIQMLQAGGNAIDALLAAQWVLAVTEPQSSGLGGGGFLLYYQAKSKRVYALDGREEAPSGIDETIFLTKENKPMPFLMRVEGARAVGVPGTVALMEYAKKRFGNSQIPFARTFESALKMARQGIRVSSRLSQAMHLNRARFLKQNRGYNPYLHSDKPYNVGEILYQDDLADTLALLKEEGTASFYKGAIAKDIL
ncbi:MAG TPA: gamma-glutamyltransferase, partial [Turneriella sp.]|nr:gamma-glutamyltransferase [Turneriella sp.]